MTSIFLLLIQYYSFFRTESSIICY